MSIVYLRTFYRFFRRFSCCRAVFSSLNTELGQSVPPLEAASHLLGAGVARSGATCGVLIGSLMSAGLALYGRYTDDGAPAWVEAARKIASGFAELTRGRLTCAELTAVDFSGRYGFWSYIFSARWVVCAPLAAKHAGRTLEIIKSYRRAGSGEVGFMRCGERAVAASSLDDGLKRAIAAAVSTLFCGCASGQVCGALAAKILIAGIESFGDGLGLAKAAGSELFDPEALYAKALVVLDGFEERFGSIYCSKILGGPCEPEKLNEILAGPPCSLMFS